MNKDSKKISYMIKSLWHYLSKRRKKQILGLLILMVLASFFEVIGIGVVLPFLGVLAAPEHLFQHPLMQPLIKVLDISESNELILPITILFIITVIVVGTIRTILLYAITRLSCAIGSDISVGLYRQTLYQDYAVHLQHNSSKIINLITSKTNIVINQIIYPTLILISSILVLIAVITTLFFMDTVATLTAIFGFGFFYCLVIYFTREKLKNNSLCIADQTSKMVKLLQEGLGGIRDVIIDGAQKFYCQLYGIADSTFRRATGNNQFISGSPKYLLEAIGMILIAVLAYVIFQQNGISTALPVLGTLALGAQRLLPISQQAFNSYSLINGARSSFKDVMHLLEQPSTKYADQASLKPIPFEKEIKLDNVSFRYTEEAPIVLKDISVTIKKGERVGFVGKTGSGKSTMLDIIMGLLSPSSGQLIVDHQSINIQNRSAWQSHIAHVPQNIFLSDTSVAENIAFGVSLEKINYKRVREASKKAQIAELIEGWPEQYQTLVGERGIRLSGGQRQRIGIARALYKEASVLIFDEATSALDSTTEQSVMSAIEDLGKDLTILIIAHRLTTLKSCNKIFNLEKDNKIHILNYNEVLGIN